MLKVVTVLRTEHKAHGTSWKPEHAYKIQDMCNKYISDHTFYCLTNETDLNCNMIPLEHDWYGWWSKMELYKIPGPVLYFDLDTIILDNIDNIIQEIKDCNFTTLGTGVPGKKKNVTSSIMYWKNDVSYLYEEFKKLKYTDIVKTEIRTPAHDQQMIGYLVNEQPESFWKPLPKWGESIASFKVHYKKMFEEEDTKKLKKVKIIHFHGKPRPWEQDIIPY
jgi:hypothetical protein